jgi:MerR family copper efflux transcriptional regulator
MLIGELAKRSGLTRDTIRFYEKEGLIGALNPGKKILRSNTYKDYPESAVSALLFIQRTKALGFTLAEIRKMLIVRDQGKPSKKWATEAEGKLRSIDQKIRELLDVKRLLSEALARCSDQCFDSGCEVLDDAVERKSGSAPRPARIDRSTANGGCC